MLQGYIQYGISYYGRAVETREGLGSFFHGVLYSRIAVYPVYLFDEDMGRKVIVFDD